MIKRVLVVMMLVLLIADCVLSGVLIGRKRTDKNLYATIGLVTSIDYEKDIVTVEDADGQLWDFYGAEDFEEGGTVAMILNSKGTAKVTDDEVVSARLIEWVEG